MRQDKDRLMCNVLYCKNGTLVFKQVDSNLSVNDLIMIADFHRLILDTMVKNKCFNHELTGYRFALTKENHMSWRIDVFKDEVYSDFFGFKCKAKDHGIPSAIKNRYYKLIEDIC